jgi:hypothetical protein
MLFEKKKLISCVWNDEIGYEAARNFIKKKPFGIKSKGFLYAYFFQDLIQHHN